MIKIIETRVVSGKRAVDFIISNGGQSFIYSVGQLSLEGDLQSILDAQEAELWIKAQANGKIAPRDLIAKSNAEQWLLENPAQLFTLSVADLEAEINNLVDEILPAVTTSNRRRVKELWLFFALHVRIPEIPAKQRQFSLKFIRPNNISDDVDVDDSIVIGEW